MNIYITPQNEAHLRKYAEDYPNMSMSGLINNLVSGHFAGNTDVHAEIAKVPVEKPDPKKIETPQPSERTMADVLADIKLAEKERDDGLEFNQDPDSRRLIETKSATLIKQLWDEYHKLKGTA